MAEFKQCAYCGRKGVRNFTPLLRGWKCTSTRTCYERRQRWNRKFASRSRGL